MFARGAFAFPARAAASLSHRRCMATATVANSQKWRKLIGGGILGSIAIGYIFRETADEKNIRETLSQSRTNGSIAFYDTEQGLQAKSTGDIIKSLVVFKICSVSWFVNSADRIVKICQQLHVTAPLYFMAKHTFFSYFCAGENEAEVSAKMGKLAKSNIGSVLDLSIEVDDNDDGSVRHCDTIADRIIEGLAVAATQPSSFMAVKITALTKPETLIRMTERLNYVDSVYCAVAGQEGAVVTPGQMMEGLEKLGFKVNADEVKSLVEIADHDKDGLIDLIGFRAMFPLTQPIGQTIIGAQTEKAELDQSKLLALPEWTESDVANVHDVVNRMERICSAAKKLGVKIMVDAEQSYFQRGIDYVATTLASRHNRESALPLVFNTHQMYLRGAVDALARALETARREGWVPGFKLVRGAYMVGEGRRALMQGKPSPVCDNKDDVDRSYDSGVALLLDAIQHAQQNNSDQSPAFMVASHNETSCMLAIKGAAERKIARESPALVFGQLLGMRDHVSYSLAASGYHVAKYLPYGPVPETLPYLLRRTQENSAVLANNKVEMTLLQMELKRRVTLPITRRAKLRQGLLATEHK